MIFPENIGTNLSIDEVSLSQGELYTFVTNKEGKGKKGTLVASIKGTQSKDIIAVLNMLPLPVRERVQEVTLDMAKNMESSVKSSFSKASLVTDRFHVVKLVLDALQHVRIKLRWEEIDKENEAIEQAKKENKKYIPRIFKNGDSPKQLLARGRYLLFKKEANWTYSQAERSNILFKEYPVLEQAYKHVMLFRNIYEDTNSCSAKKRIEQWISDSKNHEIKEFNTAANSIEYHLDNILNFFINRNTNANAESFNSKIKLFRANLRGVTDTTFFLFRLNKLFA
jgi:transposase